VNKRILFLAGALLWAVGANSTVARTPHDDPDNRLFTYGYSVASGHGIDASVITLPDQPVDQGFRGRGYGAACANAGTSGPDCD
jgi:hypothetical protein